MFCPGCKTLCDEDAIFCGNCGKQIVPLRARGATVAEPIVSVRSDGLKRNSPYRNAIPRRPVLQMPPPSPQSSLLPSSFAMKQTPIPARPDPNPPAVLSSSDPAPLLPKHNQSQYLVRNIFISFLLLMLIMGASAGLVALSHRKDNNANAKNAMTGVGASGLVSFSDSQGGQGLTNTLKLKISGLGAPPNNLHYYAWVVDAASEKTLALGRLVAQSQSFNLAFTDKINLLGVGDQLEITQEPGNPMFPAGEVVLSGTLPPLALIHIRHLLVRFDTTPGQIGLLVGLRDQARILNQQAQLLQSFSGKGQHKTACAAQSIINIIEGTGGKNTQPLADICATFNITNVGDGFGLLNPGDPNAGYIVLSAEHAALAAIQSDATPTIRTHAQHVEIATANIKKWVTTIDNDARQLVANPGNTALITEITMLANHVLNGVDRDDDGQVDPIVGEAGALTAYNEGQMMAQLTLGQGQ
jgi:hypothetical protein